jgi:hypothetical protein
MPHNIIHRGHDGVARRRTRCEPFLGADLVPLLVTSLISAVRFRHAAVRVVGAAVTAEYGALFHAVLTLGAAVQRALLARPLSLVLPICFGGRPRCTDDGCARLSYSISKAHFIR